MPDYVVTYGTNSRRITAATKTEARAEWIRQVCGAGGTWGRLAPPSPDELTVELEGAGPLTKGTLPPSWRKAGVVPPPPDAVDVPMFDTAPYDRRTVTKAGGRGR